MSESREAFLARIRKALGSPPPPESPAFEFECVRLAGRDDDLMELFATRATQVGMQVHRTDRDSFEAYLCELLSTLGVRRVMLDVPIAVPGVEAVEDGFAADAGITGVACALAETGTLVLHADARNRRVTSLVPPIHIAIVHADDLLADLLDYVADLPSCAVFVTGPSKTADIEGELVCGVHGPASVHILLVAERPPASGLSNAPQAR